MFTISKGFLGLNSREQIIRLQGQVDKQYAGLKDMAEERRRKLENMYQLFQLKREADDLEQWITEKEMVASSQEMGQDFDHVTVSTTAPAFLAVDTASHGSRPSRFPYHCRALHRDAVTPGQGAASGLRLPWGKTEGQCQMVTVATLQHLQPRA